MWTIDRSNPSCDASLGGNSGHPLDVIPFFKRIGPFRGRGIVYTLIWNTLFAAVFAAFWIIFDPQVNLMRVLWVNLVVANSIGFLIHGGFELGNLVLGQWLREASFGLRSIYYSAVSYTHLRAHETDSYL